MDSYPFNRSAADDRMTTYPISRNDLWEFYEKAKISYWVPQEITFSQDKHDFNSKLTKDEQRFVKHVLAFFASSDGIVNVNLATRFKNDVNMLEANYVYDFQMMIENIHAETYSLQIDTIIESVAEREKLFNSVKNIAVIAKMTEWMYRAIDSKATFAERLLMMACVEGIFFTGCFCAIYWLQTRSLMPGLAHANELIARDEALHTEFALHLYNIMKPSCKLSSKSVHKIFNEAVEIAMEFISDALPKGLAEMNATLMKKYIKVQANNLLSIIDVPLLYVTEKGEPIKHDFHFMNKINMANRTNFFERRVSEYSKQKEAEDDDYDVTEDF